MGVFFALVKIARHRQKSIVLCLIVLGYVYTFLLIHAGFMNFEPCLAPSIFITLLTLLDLVYFKNKNEKLIEEKSHRLCHNLTMFDIVLISRNFSLLKIMHEFILMKLVLKSKLYVLKMYLSSKQLEFQERA